MKIKSITSPSSPCDFFIKMDAIFIIIIIIIIIYMKNAYQKKIRSNKD